MSIRDIAAVRVSEPVPNRDRRRPRAAEQKPRARTDRRVTVRAEVMSAARAALQPGQRLVIISDTEVRIVNR